MFEYRCMAMKVISATDNLLAADEPAAFEMVNNEGKSSLVLVCDHASNCVPRSLDNLGLTPAQLDDHIGWDPGAAAVARLLSQLLDAPLILSGYSRLVIDCNRPLHSAQLIPAQSAGVLVPRNQQLAIEDRNRRINELFIPYHSAITELLEAREQRATILLSIHSFTPVLQEQQRPWQIGVSHWRNDRLAALLIAALKKSDSIVVGDNQPYAIDTEFDYAIPIHGEGRGLPSAMIEIRQDGVRTPEGITAWANTIAQAYRAIEHEF
jgi:predicted N-formylglutamate amidohydrolase